MDTTYSFGEWLKRKRKTLGLTQRELAERAHCSTVTIKKIEADQRRPSRELAVSLAEALAIPEEQLEIFVECARGLRPVDHLDWASGFGSVDSDVNQMRPGTRPHFSRNNIPAVTTPLIGREQELATIAGMLADPAIRLVTITGIGGIGKTTLALSTARNHTAGHYRDGVTFVQLTAVESGEQIIAAIAQALHLPLSTRDHRPSRQKILDFLRAKKSLLVIDNCEHLLESMDIVADILQAAPQVQILATSRERMRLHDEHLFLLQGLDYTDDKTNHPAAQLFVRAAQRVVPAFEITEQAAPHVNRLCKMVDGIPLALELAAAWLDTLPLPIVVEQIENNLEMLAENLSDMPVHHRSMPAVLNAAWQRLSPAAQQLLASLSVFRGSFSYEAAAAITEATPHLLAQLVSHALLKFDPENGRYQLHELVHQYAAEKLSPDQNVNLHRRHLGFFAGIADGAHMQWRDTEEILGSSRWEVDFGNIQVALDWAVEDSNCIVDGLELAGGLYDFWWFQGHLAEGHHWLTTLHRKKTSGTPLRIHARALHTLGRVQHLLKRDYASGIAYCRQSLVAYDRLADDPGRIRVLCSLGQIERHHYHLAVAESYYQQALDIARKLGDLWGQSTALHGLGAAALQRHELDAAHAYLSEGLSCAKQLGNNERIVHHYLALGMIAMEKQQWATARSMCEQALQLHRELGNQAGEQSALTSLGEIARLEKDYARASRLYRESLNLARDQGAAWSISIALFNLGQTDLMRGESDHAYTYLLEGFMLARQLEDEVLLEIFLDGFANIAASQSHPQHAAILWGAAEAAREASGDDFDIADRLQHEYFLAMAQAEIEETVFQDAWLAGRRMTLEQAVALALKHNGL